MTNYKSKRYYRIGLIIVLSLLGLVSTIGPILYIITIKPNTIEGPIMGPRTR